MKNYNLLLYGVAAFLLYRYYKKNQPATPATNKFSPTVKAPELDVRQERTL